MLPGDAEDISPRVEHLCRNSSKAGELASVDVSGHFTTILRMRTVGTRANNLVRRAGTAQGT